MNHLDGLLALVVKLQNRIKDHTQDLEVNSRYSLVDPLLRELGWDTEDPDIVIPEYPIPSKKGGENPHVDYALLSEKEPCLFIEVKVSSKLREEAAVQAHGYATQEGISNFAVTDGITWYIYEVNEHGDKEMIWSFNIAEMEPVEVCSKMLILGRQRINVRGVDAFSCFDKPEHDGPITEITHSFSSWLSIDNLPIVSQSIDLIMIFPNRFWKRIKLWVEILTATATWLIENKYITEDNCEIRNGPKNYILNTEPVHITGKKFRSKLQIENFYLEKSGQPMVNVKKTIKLIKHTGCKKHDFQFIASDSETGKTLLGTDLERQSGWTDLDPTT